MSELREITGFNDGHRTIAIFTSEQSRGRQEFWAVTENLKSKKLGFQVFWDEGDSGEVDIRIGSENWNHGQANPIVKMIYMRQKNPEESEDYPNRTIWKDKSMLLLDTAGVVYKSKRGYSMNEKNEKIHENCIDI